MTIYAVMCQEEGKQTWLTPRSADSPSKVVDEVVNRRYSETGEWDKEIVLFPLGNPLEFTAEDARIIAGVD